MVWYPGVENSASKYFFALLVKQSQAGFNDSRVEPVAEVACHPAEVLYVVVRGMH